MTVTHPRSHLNDLIHHPVRLSIVAALNAAQEMEFRDLRDMVQVSDALLSRYAYQLNDAGLVAIRKGHVGRRPKTWLALTPQGREVLAEHIAALQAIVGSGEAQRS